MISKRLAFAVLLLWSLVSLVPACSSGGGDKGTDVDGGGSADADSDSDTDVVPPGGDTDTDADSDVDSDSDTDTNTDTDTDTDTTTDTDTIPAAVKPVAGQVSGGGLFSSTNYTLKVMVGGAPMATTQSTNYSLSVGVGAFVNR